MLDKHFVESFLRLNNADTKMSDAEVHDVLARAGWSEPEISAAIALLRGTANMHMPPVNGVGASFRPDMEISSTQLSSLLGVNVNIDPAKMHYPAGVVSPGRQTLVQVFQIFAVITLSLALAAALGVSLLYYLQIGPFDPTL